MILLVRKHEGNLDTSCGICEDGSTHTKIPALLRRHLLKNEYLPLNEELYLRLVVMP